ncbi:MAG: hypothetical protein Kow0069_31920 [Promethearchaeota archaeon]
MAEGSGEDSRVRQLELERDELAHQLGELKSRLDDKTQAVEQLAKEAGELREKVAGLSAERDSLRTRLEDKDAEIRALREGLQGKVDQSAGLLQSVRDATASVAEKLERLEGTLQEKDAEIRELREKLEVYLKEKASILEEREKIIKEREESIKRVGDAEKKLALAEDRVEKLKQKIRESGDGLLGSTMEIESLNEQLQEKEEEIARLSSKIKSFTEGNTGLLFNLEETVKFFRAQVSKAKLYIRLVVPTLEDLDSNDLTELLEEASKRCTVFLATMFDELAHADRIRELIKKGFKLVNYHAGDLWAINVDGAICGLAVQKGGDVVAGLYSNIEGLVTYFKDIVMTAFVKGSKL